MSQTRIICECGFPLMHCQCGETSISAVALNDGLCVAPVNRTETNIDEAYDKFTKHKKTKHGYEISCTKGLWGITAATKEQAEREAKHYFVQYFSDGEYNT